MRTALLLTTALICAPAMAQTLAPAPTTTATTTSAPLAMRGVNIGVADAIAAWPTIMKQFPGMTAIRLNYGVHFGDPDSMSDITTVVQEYTGAGVVVEIEDHTGNPNNVPLYTQWAQAFKGNPLVFIEMPNEPVADAQTTANNQISIINAVRGAGFDNPIGIQPVGGYDFSNISTVISAVGTTGMFITPHIYYGGTDPNGAADYVKSDIGQCQQLGLPCVIDEFGNAMDGQTKDPQGDATILAVIAANEGSNGGTIQAGAIFWAADNGNHPDGADSTFLTPDGSQLTSTGSQMIQPWLFTPNKAAPTVTAATQAPEIADLQQQATDIQNAMQPVPMAPPGTAAPAPSPATSAIAPTASTLTPLEQSIDDQLAKVGLTATFSPLPTTTAPPASVATPTAPTTAPVASTPALATLPASTATPAVTAAQTAPAAELVAIQSEEATIEQQIMVLQQQMASQPVPTPAPVTTPMLVPTPVSTPVAATLAPAAAPVTIAPDAPTPALPQGSSEGGGDGGDGGE